MIWLTWRQFRIQAIAGLVVLAAVVATYVATRPALLGLAEDTGYTGCTANCGQAANTFRNEVNSEIFGRLFFLGPIVLFGTPALIGLFWGAPLVARELETGTHRLVWNQTVSRTRWLAVKLAAVGLAAAATAGLISLAITWWASPIDRAGGWMAPGVFGARGLVPIGYAAFAFVAGVAVGMLLRRTVAAMAVTLVVVAAAMVASPLVLRPHLAARTTYSAPLTADAIGPIGINVNDPSREIRVGADNPVPGGWTLSNEILTSTGETFRGPYDPASCGPQSSSGMQGCQKWIATQNLEVRAVYLGADKFWVLQWRELGVFLVASALLAAFCFWWIRRRVT